MRRVPTLLLALGLLLAGASACSGGDESSSQPRRTATTLRPSTPTTAATTLPLTLPPSTVADPVTEIMRGYLDDDNHPVAIMLDGIYAEAGFNVPAGATDYNVVEFALRSCHGDTAPPPEWQSLGPELNPGKRWRLDRTIDDAWPGRVTEGQAEMVFKQTGRRAVPMSEVERAATVYREATAEGKRKGLPRVWLTFFVPGEAGPEGCRHAEEVPSGVQA
jgi:hypothetical protein